MELLITVNNLIGPAFRLVGLAIWALTLTSLAGAFFYSKSKESLLLIAHLSALVAISWIPEIWGNAFTLMIAHLITYTITLCFVLFGGFLRSVFGDWFLLLAGTMAYLDAFAYLFQPPIQVHLWAINILFLLMCCISFVAGLRCHDNSGNLGGNRNANSQ